MTNQMAYAVQGNLDFPDLLTLFIQGHLKLIVNIFHLAAATIKIMSGIRRYNYYILTIQKFYPRMDWLFCRLYE